MREIMIEVLDRMPEAEAGKIASNLQTLIDADRASHDLAVIELIKDKSRARELFPNANDDDFDLLEANSNNIAALSDIIATGETHEFFSAEPSDEIGRKFSMTVIVEFLPKKTVKKISEYFVTSNYPDNAKLLAVEMYNKIIEENSKDLHVANVTARVRFLSPPERDNAELTEESTER